MSFGAAIKSLRSHATHFEEAIVSKQFALLDYLASQPLPHSKQLISYQELLLFMCAYPGNSALLKKAEKELSRISMFLLGAKQEVRDRFINSGLPYTVSHTGFSHDCLRWLLSQKDCHTEIDSYKNPQNNLNNILGLTLPSLEASETTAGLTNEELLNALKVSKKNRLPFLIDELSRFDRAPLVKDHLFDSLSIYVNVTSKNKSFSKAFNRIAVPKLFYHGEIIKKFDHRQLISSSLPRAVEFDTHQKDEVVNVIKRTMVLTQRETDTSVYMDERVLQLFHLERGISVAIYGMVPSRQLPLESYVGYTLFKNGFPAAYGGAWVFGEYANFGINIFESFRGGESGFTFCQLLRVYHQAFGVKHFEVEPYQYGLDNPEGIQSGAFWFYYKYGFRPIDKALRKLAENEYKKLSAKSGLRTNEKILLRFTESNMSLSLESGLPTKVSSITNRVTQMIHHAYHDDRIAAEKDCMNKFISAVRLELLLNEDEIRVLKEVSLWAGAFQIKDKKRLDLLKQMVFVKPYHLEKYQQLLLDFLSY